VYRQGQLLGTTPIRVLLAGKQSVEVTLSAQGHTAQRFRLVTGGLSGQVDLELESQIGVVQIRAPVDNPKVQVDGRMIVVGHEHTLPVGRHTLHVMHPCADYEPVTVDVKPDAYTIVDPKVRSPCGQVTIKSDTPGATVLIGTEAYPLPHTLSRAVSWTRKFWVHAPGRVAKTLMVEPTKEDVTLQVNFGPRSAAGHGSR
jgi:hypothetical protein